MKTTLFSLGVAVTLCSQVAFAQIANVTDANGDANRPIEWTGQTFTLAGQPWTNYTVGTFGDKSPAYVDRTHVYRTTPMLGSGTWNWPSYLQGASYIMTANDNRDNTNYSISLTLSQPAYVYLFIDNRGGGNDGNANDPPMLGTSTNMMGTGFMTWVLDDGFQGKTTGINRFGTSVSPNFTVPDELAMDESNNGTLDNYASVYWRRFGAGTVTLGEFGLGGRNMYGVAVTVVPEPSALALLGGALVFFALRRRC